ncbi:hypothetical protein K469DRAFT_711955 [Zopfia rhizophila CBS 207.26]|uniref:Uncharacterized protein n=1 Tax=Zopfia rhizophila CBS 207.26 TaxID=1314779 RepID=A0A6A6DW27_9PEZI|nr:hypothetical protein K469DRAFT_711955 [Zopfia rhizophila CBS 207.26]
METSFNTFHSLNTRPHAKFILYNEPPKRKPTSRCHRPKNTPTSRRPGTVELTCSDSQFNDQIDEGGNRRHEGRVGDSIGSDDHFIFLNERKCDEFNQGVLVTELCIESKDVSLTQRTAAGGSNRECGRSRCKSFHRRLS